MTRIELLALFFQLVKTSNFETKYIDKFFLLMQKD